MDNSSLSDCVPMPSREPSVDPPPPSRQITMPDTSPDLNEERATGPQPPTDPQPCDNGHGAPQHFVTQIIAPVSKKRRAGKSATARKAAKGGKPGNPGTFTGEDGVYLTSLLKDYITARDVMSRGRGKNTKLDAFWGCMIAGFWERFEWSAYARDGETKEATIERINAVSQGLE